MAYREVAAKERVVVDQSQPVSNVLAAAAIPVAFFLCMAYAITTAVVVDCDRAEGQCTFVTHTLLRKETTRVPIGALSSLEMTEEDGCIVAGDRKPVVSRDSTLQEEKRKLVARVRAFSTDASPSLHAEAGHWWWPGESVLILLFAAAVVVSILGRGKLVVVLDPGANALVVRTKRYWVVPNDVRLELSSIASASIEDLEGRGDYRVRIGAAASNTMTKEKAEAAALAVNAALDALRDRERG